METKVFITTEEYAELLKNKMMLDMLFRAIYVGADLNWNKTSVSLNKDKLVEFLQVADHERFTAIYKKLKAEDEEATNESV